MVHPTRCIVIPILFVLFQTNSSVADEEYRCRLVDKDWSYFSDHIGVATHYAIVGPEGRNYEVGTGVSVNGKPRGRKYVMSGANDVTAYGAGALHIRRADNGDDFKVCAGGGGVSTITILRMEF